MTYYTVSYDYHEEFTVEATDEREARAIAITQLKLVGIVPVDEDLSVREEGT